MKQEVKFFSSILSHHHLLEGNALWAADPLSLYFPQLAFRVGASHKENHPATSVVLIMLKQQRVFSNRL
jgi:hypothetical protein